MKIFLIIVLFTFSFSTHVYGNRIHLNCKNYLTAHDGMKRLVAYEYSAPDIHVIYSKFEDAKIIVNIPFLNPQEFVLNQSSSEYFFRSDLIDIEDSSYRVAVELNIYNTHLTYRMKVKWDGDPSSWFKYKSKSGINISNSSLNHYYRCEKIN